MYKLRSKSGLIKFLGIVLILLAVSCSALLAAMQIKELAMWYDTFQEQLLEFEHRVAAIEQKSLVIAVVFALFTIKSFFPLITIPAICVITGMVLPGYAAIIVNLLGIVWLMTIRFFWGKRLGGGNARRIIKMNSDIKEFLERDGTGNPYMLFLFRLIPSFPVNSVSQLYGAMDIGYWEYITISVAGFSYKLLSYTIIGRNVYNPLSASFLVPIIIFLLISGSLLVGLNYIIDFVIKIREKRNLFPRHK